MTLKTVTTAVRIGVGIFLLITAVLKTQGLISDPLKTELLGIPAFLQIIALEVEFVLALWLLSGIQMARAIAAAAIFFAIVSLVAAKQVFERQASCGCFGALDVNPAYTLMLDLVLFAVLVIAWFRTRHDTAKDAAYSEIIRTIAVSTSMLLVVLTLPGLVGAVDYTSVLRTLRGEYLSICPRVVDLGSIAPGEKLVSLVEVWNHGDTTIRIVGGTASCGCMVHEDLPKHVPPHSQVTLRIQVTHKKGQGQFRHRYVLYTSHPNQPQLHGGVTGWLSAKSLDVS
jgi:hypothetical protein